MSEHNINLKEKRRLILICGTNRIEIFCYNINFIEFCPICGENILKIKIEEKENE